MRSDAQALHDTIDADHPGPVDELNPLAYVLLMTARGVPVIYSGDEQGFTGDGGDQAAREDLSASRIASYSDNRLIGSRATTATANFDTAHPLYRLIADLAQVRARFPAVRRGATRVLAADERPGLLAFSRTEAGSMPVLVLLNSATTPLDRHVAVRGNGRPRGIVAGALRASLRRGPFV